MQLLLQYKARYLRKGYILVLDGLRWTITAQAANSVSAGEKYHF